MKPIQVGIVGATGYAGVELIRILLNHPGVELAGLCSVSFEGKTIDQVYPAFHEIIEKTLVNEDEVIDVSDVIFTGVPHGVCEAFAVKALAKGKKVIDLGADFRLDKEEDFQQWYGLPYRYPQLHQKSAYCIPELHRDRVPGKEIIGNPGCYPTSIALGLAPLLKSGKAEAQSIIIDSKSGVTGSGRGLSQTSHYPECNEAFSPYKVAAHRHTPEIEQTLSQLAGEELRVTFVPHLLPVNRGIVSTIYAGLKQPLTAQVLHEMYRDFYQKEKFVRVLPLGEVANLRNVKYSNYCDISLHLDSRTNRAIIVSTIDNMVKGAAGQAVQNMNLLFGLPEDTGLGMIPPSF